VRQRCQLVPCSFTFLVRTPPKVTMPVVLDRLLEYAAVFVPVAVVIAPGIWVRRLWKEHPPGPIVRLTGIFLVWLLVPVAFLAGLILSWLVECTIHPGQPC
jgi:hypothetical protein